MTRRGYGTIGAMVERLYFTDSDEANALIASDPLALLIGFALDQQVTVQKAFSGPLVLLERLGHARRRRRSSATRPRADLPRAPGDPPLPRRDGDARARARHARPERYDGDAARVWTDAASSAELKANLEALPASGR